MLTGVSPRKIPESRSIVTTTRCSVISRTVRVLGTATSMPDCSTGAVIIKMTSRTSTTSTRGVMLISASEVWVRPLLLVKATFNLVRQIAAGQFAARLRALPGGPCMDLFEGVQQLAAEVVDGRGEDLHAGGELV